MDQKRELTDEGKKKYADVKVQRIFHLDSQKTQLIFFRYQILTTVSGIASAFAGLIITSTNKALNPILAGFATAILLGTTLASLWICLNHGRKDIKMLHAKIEEVPNLNIWQQSKVANPKLFGYWPEILFAFLVVGIFLFTLSLVCF